MEETNIASLHLGKSTVTTDPVTLWRFSLSTSPFILLWLRTIWPSYFDLELERVAHEGQHNLTTNGPQTIILFFAKIPTHFKCHPDRLFHLRSTPLFNHNWPLPIQETIIGQRTPPLSLSWVSSSLFLLSLSLSLSLSPLSLSLSFSIHCDIQFSSPFAASLRQSNDLKWTSATIGQCSFLLNLFVVGSETSSWPSMTPNLAQWSVTWLRVMIGTDIGQTAWS